MTKEEFTPAAAATARIRGIPKLDDDKSVAKQFLPLMVSGPNDLDRMLKINEWIQQKFGGLASADGQPGCPQS